MWLVDGLTRFITINLPIGTASVFCVRLTNRRKNRSVVDRDWRARACRAGFFLPLVRGCRGFLHWFWLILSCQAWEFFGADRM